jgi:hypothetical protein
MQIKVSEFVKSVPQVARQKLPRNLQNFKVILMPWLSQVYYDDKLLHYELVKLPSRYGENTLEIGLHFESRDHMLNSMLLAGFDRYLFEVRDALGEHWYAEPWDKGWTKIYTTFGYESMDEDFVEQTAEQLARTITTMEPIFRLVSKKKKRG